MFFFLLYSAALLFKVLSSRHPSSLAFLQEIVMLAFVSYTASLVSSMFNEEISTNRMRLWVTAPVSKAQLFISSIKKILLRVVLSSTIWAAIVVLLFFLKYRMLPVNYFLIVGGVASTTVVLVLFVFLVSISVRGNLSLPLMIFIPWILLVMQLDPGIMQQHKRVLYSIMPIAIGIRSVYNGVFPLISPSVITMSDFLYITLWSLGVFGVLLVAVNKRGY
ncbi:MAG: hypothetical protein KAR40_08555 [Candidatus Sabulitectum sp.]|nr:hypothetical protein [Candidatus Sabulitectum sp.]